MAEYSVNKNGTDYWRDTNVPQLTPTVKSALDENEWEEIWFTDTLEAATAACPSGFSVGPRPPKPH